MKETLPGLLERYALAEVAKILYDIQQFIHRYKAGESFSVQQSPDFAGVFVFQPLPKDNRPLASFLNGSVEVDYPEVEDFFRHFLQGFPDMRLTDWRELIITKTPLPHAVINQLHNWGNASGFTCCATCQICQDLNENA